MTIYDAVNELVEVEKALAITTPTPKKIQRVYWATPRQDKQLVDLPSILNSPSMTSVEYGYGRRIEQWQVTIRCAVRAQGQEDDEAAKIATQFFVAAQQALFDNDTLNSTVRESTFYGEPIVNFMWAELPYIGFNGTLEAVIET